MKNVNYPPSLTPGSLRERRTYQDSQWKDDELSPLRESRRGLFLKASYLYRF